MSPPSGPTPAPRGGRARSPLLRSIGFALRGIGRAAAYQRNFRIHLAAAAAAVGLGAILRVSPGEFALIAVVVALVMAAELLNTAIEAAVDLASPDVHPMARTAKDAAAGAVLVAALGAVVVGLAVFLPKLLALL